MKRLIHVILFILSIIIVILAALTILFVVNKKDGYVTKVFGYTSFLNTGNSMLPDIKQGDLLIFHEQDEYKEDDIISYINDENIIVTHRIVDVSDEGYTTKGDSNNFIDGYLVKKTDIYGKLIFKTDIVPKIIEYRFYGYGILAFIGIVLFLSRAKDVR